MTGAMIEPNGKRGDVERGRLQAILDAPPPLVDAVGSLVNEGITRVLSTSDAVTSAAEGRKLLNREEGNEELADQVQRVVVLAVPVVRTLARGARFTRLPWVLIASTTFSIGATVRAGIREVQVIGALLSHRLENATGRPADPALVQRLAVELYLSPRETPGPGDRPPPLRRLLQRWVFRGAFGRDTKRVTSRALDAAERLDMTPYTVR
jgi:hypothetical protein